MFVKKVKWAVALLACSLLLCACGENVNQVQSGEETEPASVDSLTENSDTISAIDMEPIPVEDFFKLQVVEDGKTSFKVVRSDDASDEVSVAAIHLRKAINAITGANVGITSDLAKTQENAKEIVVGSSNRTEAQAFQATLTGYSFGIKITENRILIVATHEDFVPLAVDYFMEHYLVNGDYVEIGEGTFSISSAAGVICSGERADLTNIRENTNYATLSELVANIPKEGNFKALQGGCVTEDYAYMAVLNTTDYDTKDAGCYIYKLSTKTWKIIKRSKVLMLAHANDMTYNPNNNMLYVAHCYVDSTAISLIDADTLELVETIHTDSGVYAIDYHAATNTFVGGQGKSGTIFFRFANNNTSKLITSGKITATSTQMVTQGICRDDNYVYHVMFSTAADEPYNTIIIYDLESKKLAHYVRLSISGQEPENISLVNGEFYIGCNSSTTQLDIYKSVLYEFDFDACVPCP